MSKDVLCFGRELIVIFEGEYKFTDGLYRLFRIRNITRTESFDAVAPWVPAEPSARGNLLWPFVMSADEAAALRPQPCGIPELLAAKENEPIRLSRRSEAYTRAYYGQIGSDLYLIQYRLDVGSTAGQWHGPTEGELNMGWPLKLPVDQAPVSFSVSLCSREKN